MSSQFIYPLLQEPGMPGSVLDEATIKENESHTRAMPMQRLLGGGMDYADAVALHDVSRVGMKWVEAAEQLGNRNQSIAEAALVEGRRETARSYFHYASACFRASHSAIFFDDDRKRALYARMVSCFGKAAKLERHEITKIDVPFELGFLCGWLVKPRAVPTPPLVVCLGGFDGWREEYFPGAQYLADRGVAVLLIDGPGQGETRLLNRIYFGERFVDAISAVVDAMTRQLGYGKVGIWGNSMGGYLAAACALRDDRIVACCVNGGTVRPAEILDRYPRFLSKVQALYGTADAAEAETRIGTLDISSAVARLSCALLQLHSVPDRVFLLENARKIFDAASSIDKSLVVWADGDHCIYNHSHEKFCTIADWFATRLSVASQTTSK
ncbi:alpha/beta fold hydrolase [Burkholderia cenocepacia]|uniref:alpha/beta hydrolase family protein n=1 Tax=Burkholderia cenocepacia TaxID=95486 RepID=UPI000F57C928|nr:alpha/beta fold hydrolase [Burkholderia cenocepacia]RQU46132.1 alpha/beta fold hydrolase [Burkholderia cenocepacia]RQU73736.1 alpha/beta fold hydrolase [Burkholderia cenocepacia]RQU96215.1 alpha/beta fold hydrolase [Burkholderia cenocepacia]RQV33572.1 alpha/beta fold hydrolase [Burkholderia cenocepacia]RQV47798.1 alpha/beta fold hydrolase [Burkholderia cenocepacia]